MRFIHNVSDKNGLQLQVGDEVTHVANPKIKGKVVGSPTGDKNHYLNSSWIPVIFEEVVQFSGNPGRASKEWTCSSCLLIKTV